MIGLSDSQLEIITSTAEPLAEEKCQEFLERVAEAIAALREMGGQINDDDVSIAVRLALRGLIKNSAAGKEWNRNSLATRQNGKDTRPHRARGRRTLLPRLLRGLFPYLKSVGNNFHRSHRRFDQTHTTGN